MTLKKIAFIGTGVMGSSIVRHLLKADYEVTIYTRTKERATLLLVKAQNGLKLQVKQLQGPILL